MASLAGNLAGTVSGKRGDRASQAARTSPPGAFLLDRNMSVMPVWAVCCHTQLSTRQEYSIRVRRSSDDAEADIGFTRLGALDMVALAAHCGSGLTDDGFVVRFYNAGSAGGFLVQATKAKQVKVWSAGAPVLDARENLTLSWDADAGQSYEAAYVAAGDLNITIVYDGAPVAAAGQISVYLSDGDVSKSLEVDTNFDVGGWAELQWADGSSTRTYSYFDESVGWDRSAGWFQFGRNAGDAIVATQQRANGADYDQVSTDVTTPDDANITTLAWTPLTDVLSSFFIIFRTPKLSVDDQAVLDAWASTRYANGLLP